jgi:predicted MFS family arabinose efflux permease
MRITSLLCAEIILPGVHSVCTFIASYCDACASPTQALVLVCEAFVIYHQKNERSLIIKSLTVYRKPKKPHNSLGDSQLMTTTESKLGRLGLMVAHCAGMVDLVALPLWISALMTHYRMNAQQAGGLITLFLLGAVISSVVTARAFNHLPTRFMAVTSYAISAFAFGLLVFTNNFASMAALHTIGGMATGSGLSVTHGTIGRSANPHRTFALVNFAIAVFVIAFYAVTPRLIAEQGGAALFMVLASVMALAAATSALTFPRPTHLDTTQQSGGKIRKEVWFGMLGISCMGLIQAMLASFSERIGIDRGFDAGKIATVFVMLGFVNLLPAFLAGLLEKKLSIQAVTYTGPVLQAALALLLALSSSFATYAFVVAVFASIVIFTHSFAFGLLAKLDSTGRAVAATPAMLMAGSAFGPALAGTLVQSFGYVSLGFCAVGIALISLFGFHRAQVS